MSSFVQKYMNVSNFDQTEKKLHNRTKRILTKLVGKLSKMMGKEYHKNVT